MANIFLNLEKNIEVLAEDALAFISRAETVTLPKAPGAIAALGVVLGAVAASLKDIGGAAANPLNISLDTQAVADLKTVWPDVVKLAESLGIKL